MGFLDNSGDIILDAVLTDVGRKRMAQGNFKITKFAIGDDEIDYGLYNKAMHPARLIMIYKFCRHPLWRHSHKQMPESITDC